MFAHKPTPRNPNSKAEPPPRSDNQTLSFFSTAATTYV